MEILLAFSTQSFVIWIYFISNYKIYCLLFLCYVITFLM